MIMFTRRLRNTHEPVPSITHSLAVVFIFFLFCICCINTKESSLNCVALFKNVFPQVDALAYMDQKRG